MTEFSPTLVTRTAGQFDLGVFQRAAGGGLISDLSGYPLGAFTGRAVTNNSTYAVLILDTFTDANMAIDAHTIAPTNVPATSWVIGSGTPRIYGNALIGDSGGDDICALDTGRANFTASMTFVAWDYYGVIGRYSDVNNYWMAYAIDNGVCRLIKREASVDTVMASGNVTPNTSISIQFNGTLITAKFGSLTLTYTSSFNQAATKAGVYLKQTTYGGDNFQVTT